MNISSDAWPVRKGEERSSYAELERSIDGVGFVYFIGESTGERIKIGYTGNDNWDRLLTHRKGDAFGRGGDFTMLAAVRTTQQSETYLKSYFAQHLVVESKKREVFAAEPLLPYVTWLRDHYFVSTTLPEFYSPEGRTVIDPQAWLPGEGRVSYRRSERMLFAQMDPWSILPSRVTTGDDYYTPRHIMECVREALGGVIDLDPASHVMANQVVQAKQFYTRDQNGLMQPWGGRVYLNPPFSSWPEWVEKVLSEVGQVDEMVLLGATRTLTAQYFERLLRRVDAICIIAGRTPFWGIATDSDSPTDGHFLLYIGPNVDRFRSATVSLGASWWSK